MFLSEQRRRRERGMARRRRRLGQAMIIRRHALLAAFAKPLQKIADGSRGEIEDLTEFRDGGTVLGTLENRLADWQGYGSRHDWNLPE